MVLRRKVSTDDCGLRRVCTRCEVSRWSAGGIGEMRQWIYLVMSVNWMIVNLTKRRERRY